MSRVMLITGGSTGIGAETARLLAKEGWRIIISARSEAKAQKVIEEITAAGGEAAFVHGDVAAGEEALKEMVEKAIAVYGHLDAAFNNAGTNTDSGLFEDLRTESFQDMINCNMLGTFWCMKHELKHFSKAGAGTIVNCASIGGLHGIPFTGTYVATKHAVVGMTRTAAVEYAAKGITVNAVAPGSILTDIMKKSFEISDWNEEKVANLYPMKRMGKEIDVARGVSYLINSPYVTGTVLEIEGGFRVRTNAI